MIIVIIVSILMLLFPVAFLMNHIQTLLNNDVRVNLTEIVTQNKDIIKGRIDSELSALHIKSTQIVDEASRFGEVNDENLNEAFQTYATSHSLQDIFIAHANGVAYFNDAATMDIKGRQYFKDALAGNSNISEKLISRKTGEEVFIVSVPIMFEGEIVGTIHKTFTNPKMQELLAVSLYSSQGYIYMINSEGYILYHSDHPDCHRGSDNYYRDLYEQGAPDESKVLSTDIQANKTGFLETNLDSGAYFAAYTPLEGLYDWYIVSSVKTEAVMYNSSIVVQIFYGILIFIVLFFAILASIFWSYKNRQQRRLLEIAFVDNVTKGDTVNKFIMELQQLLINAKPNVYSILKFDIDNFKYINKYYGFDHGDEVLRKIIKIFNKELEAPEMIARISSDNFVVLLKDDSLERIKTILNKVKVSEEWMTFISAGVYKIQNIDENVNIMIDKASMASNTIKGNANDKICYYTAEFDLQLQQDEELKRDVQKGIQNGEFVPYFQPKVNVQTKEIIGAEALVRWNHPTKGLVSPAVFIPLCEKSGLITEIDMLIYDKVLHFLQDLEEKGIPRYPISINFSRMHLMDLSFLTVFKDLAIEHKIPSNLIELELTESAIFDNMEMLLEFTKIVHGNGFTLAMDDFGSGYSSLNMLKNIPIDVLKVDKEFLSESDDPIRRKVIFETMVQMARKLNIDIIVEGVETLENVELMNACDCKFAQGYYFARPMDMDKIIDLFKEGKV